MTSGRTIQNIVDDIPLHCLVGVIQVWLWEFEEPQNWPAQDDARLMIDELHRRHDASSREVREAIKECELYIAEDGWRG